MYSPLVQLVTLEPDKVRVSDVISPSSRRPWLITDRGVPFADITGQPFLTRLGFVAWTRRPRRVFTGTRKRRGAPLLLCSAELFNRATCFLELAEITNFDGPPMNAAVEQLVRVDKKNQL